MNMADLGKNVHDTHITSGDDTVDRIKKLRSSQAANLTRACTKAKNAMTSGRSKATLKDLEESINELFNTLYTTNNIYKDSNADSSIDTWIDKYSEMVKQILDELEYAQQREDIPAVSVMTTPSIAAESVHSTGSQRLRLEAEQAELEAKQAEDRAKMARQFAELEAERIKRRADLEANQEVERARHRARGLHAMAEAALEAEISSHSVMPDPPVSSMPVRNVPHIARPIENTQNIQTPILLPENPTPNKNKVESWLVTECQEMSTEQPIDAWIDHLTIGRETECTSTQNRSTDALTHAIVRLESERDLPSISLPVFSGSPIEWPRFIDQFHTHVHTRPGITDSRRMELLQSHLKGEALNLVRGLNFSGRNYALALKELKRSFGHKIQVARAYIDKLTNGGIISSRDPGALRQFYINVRDCVTTMKQLNYTSYLYGSDTLLKATQRLPSDKVHRWNDNVRRILKTREPNLLDLEDWLRDGVEAEFNPYAVNINRSHQTNNQTRYQTTPKRTMKTASTNSYTKSPSNTTCPICPENHYIYRCSVFQNANVTKRRELAQQNKLCFNCLKRGHLVSKCMSTIRCREDSCGKKHHTLLHDNKQLDNSTNVAVKATKRQSHESKVFFQIIPVIVKGNNGQSIRTHAILDTASEITLIDEKLAKTMGLKGERKQLTLQTVSSETTQTSRVVSLSVKSANSIDAKSLFIKHAWTVDGKAFKCPSQTISDDWKHLEKLCITDIDSSDIQMLIGANVPMAHVQTDIRMGGEDQPIAIQTILGWSIMGPTSQVERQQAHVNLLVSNHDSLHQQMERFWSTESFGITNRHNSPASIEDRRGEEILKEKTRFNDGHYEVGMLWKSKDIQLPNNYTVAERRFQSLRKRLERDCELKTLYCETLNSYIAKGHAEKLTQEDIKKTSPRTWYIPHHGVMNPNKPGKVRVVFDAAARFSNTSLNEQLMTGPDLLNSLFGVLQRFRQYSTAIVGDIEGMFHQVRVPEEDSNALRFLWKENLDAPGPPDIYRMTVHIFGATDSPCCANYALRRTGQDNKEEYSPESVQATARDFYVDDFLKSVDNPQTAIAMVEEMTSLLMKGGFNLHKWISNSLEVQRSTSAVSTKNMDLSKDSFTIQRTLGLKWNTTEDNFIFCPKPKDVPATKRGVVSTVCSIFDPCGFLAPFTLRAKCLIQDLWRAGLDWDDTLTDHLETRWNSWLQELNDLNVFQLPRHHQHLNQDTKQIQLHLFSDASELGFGAVAYLKYTTASHGNICSFLAAKTHVAPIKPVLSIPRLELQGAVMATRLASTLQDELDLHVERIFYWTDSTVVLRYIKNESKRFKPFVANRVSEILEHTCAEQWRHVPSDLNPADHASRGLHAVHMNTKHPWLHGPQFLQSDEGSWPSMLDERVSIDDDDPEVKITKTVIAQAGGDNKDNVMTRLNVRGIIDPSRYSSLKNLIRHTTWVLRAVRNFISVVSRFKLKPEHSCYLQPEDCKTSEEIWVKEAQIEHYSEEINDLKTAGTIKQKSPLLPLTPFYDGSFLRIGGRLRKASIPSEAKHQLLLPESHHITRLIMSEVHNDLAHCGREHLIAAVRQRYWPVNARRTAKQVIYDCLYCRRMRIKPNAPLMADLPKCRLSASSGPFFNTGVDYFGPIIVKERRNRVKKWGCLFTCLSTRAVHLEMADSLETDDFIMVLRNFIGRRGHPNCFYSDNGTNFQGAATELKKSLKDMQQSMIHQFLVSKSIKWKFNPPQTPHFGGAWERLVKSVKTALNSVLKNTCVSESVLRTALIEVEAVLNSRPLTYNSADPNDMTALTPNHFLLGRANSSLPPGVFAEKEINSRRKWRQVQVLTDHIVRRWTREYLPTLTIRHKWRSNQQEVDVGDLVLLVNDSQPRGHWELGRITAKYPGDDGKIRTLKVKTTKGEYIRPASKLCILEEST